MSLPSQHHAIPCAAETALRKFGSDIWGRGSRALVRAQMLRQDLEGNFQHQLAATREMSDTLKLYGNFTREQVGLFDVSPSTVIASQRRRYNKTAHAHNM